MGKGRTVQDSQRDHIAAEHQVTGQESLPELVHDTLITKRSQEDLALCVICHQAAVLRSAQGKPCNWTAAVGWINEHQD
jgi:hypothetical protein